LNVGGLSNETILWGSPFELLVVLCESLDADIEFGEIFASVTASAFKAEVFTDSAAILDSTMAPVAIRDVSIALSCMWFAPTARSAEVADEASLAEVTELEANFEVVTASAGSRLANVA
jgi:hypothetical protein